MQIYRAAKQAVTMQAVKWVSRRKKTSATPRVVDVRINSELAFTAVYSKLIAGLNLPRDRPQGPLNRDDDAAHFL